MAERDGEHRDRERTEILSRPDLAERNFLVAALRDETTGGLLMLGAAVVALVWANSPWRDAYHTLVSTTVGPAALHLDLPISVWAADGLLAVFFFIAGLELKHELVMGSLSNVRRAVVPVAAALGGMILPALIFVAVNTLSSNGSPGGWGIPMATDIAFALAVLAVVGRRLPSALRAFLLTLAVVDDLGAILVIALFYSHGFSAGYFAAALACLVAYGLLQWRRLGNPWVYVPLALLTWFFMHESGIHATVAGVALGLLTRVRKDPGEQRSPADAAEHVVHPISAGVCVPLFAFTAAGVTLVGRDLGTAITDPVTIGIVLGLVLGKPLGVFVAAWTTARFTSASLNPAIGWRDVNAIGVLAGIGFTVSLLIAELAYDDDPARLTAAKLAVLTGSVLSALLAAITLRSRSRAYDALVEEEEQDSDDDGIPDVYQAPRPGPASG